MELRLPVPWVICIAALLQAAAALQKSPSGNVRAKSALKQRLPFYHSSDELHEDMVEAIAGCNKSVRASLSQGGANLDVVRLSATSTEKSRKQKRKAMLVFGEHARELVSPESALHLVRSLCGLESSVPPERAAAALSVADFVIVPNANPSSRRAVETGAFCKRTNENGVDLNRNWGDKHRDRSAHVATVVDKDDSTGQEQNPGPSGFSEPETRALRDLAQETRPDLFLAVHSGAYLLGMPYGYSAEPQVQHGQQMMQILATISSEHCNGQCPYGPLESVINYASPGCAMDFMVEELQVPFAFTFEIYSGGKNSEMAGTDGGKSFEGFANGFLNAGGDAVLKGTDGQESKESHDARMHEEEAASDDHCLEQFNPTDEDTFTSLLDNWSGAYIDLVSAVDKVLAPSQNAVASTSTGPGSDGGPSLNFKLEVDNTASDASFPASDALDGQQGDDSAGSTPKPRPKGPAPTLSPEAWAKATAVSGPEGDDGHMDVFSHKLHDVLSSMHDDSSEAPGFTDPNQDTQEKATGSDSSESSDVDLSLKPQAEEAASSGSSANALSEFLHPKS
jgi:hypothetical protein